jgi:hypothetical protein
VVSCVCVGSKFLIERIKYSKFYPFLANPLLNKTSKKENTKICAVSSLGSIVR